MSSNTSPTESRRSIRHILRHPFDTTKDVFKSSSKPLNEQKPSIRSTDTNSPSPALQLGTGPSPTTHSNLHLSVPSSVSAQLASAPDVALDTSAPSPSGVVGTSSDHTSHIAKTERPDSDDGKKRWGRSWVELEATLHALYQTAGTFPPLQPAIGTLISCLETIQAAAKHRQGYNDLASYLNSLIILLERHLRESGSTSMADCTSNIVRSLRVEAEYIKKKTQQSIAKGIAGANEDADELIQCYRRIESLFQLLQVDASLSTWAITQEHLANTRLEAMSPAKAASYNAAVPTNVVRRECTENTRTNVLFEMNSWSDNPDAAKVYWMNGMAGTGKTTIACSLSAALADRKQLGSSFFCTRVLEECRDVVRIVPTIAYQLARYSRPFQHALCKVLENDPDIAKRNIPMQFKRLLKEPLQEIQGAMPGNVVVVIDALDECDDDEMVRKFLDTLFQNAADLPLKFFVAGRPEPEVLEEMLSRGEAARSVLHLHEIDRASVQADIKSYLRKELAFIAPSEDELAQLVQLSDNLFIYAATTVRYIRFRKKSVNPRERLRSVLSVKSSLNKVYAELDALYRAILRGALDEDGLENDEADRVRIVLWTVVCAREPVTVHTLAVLTGLGEENTLTVLQSLGSVLHTSAANNLVSPLHASFPDFIFTPERSHDFFCDKGTHSPLLARQCFEAMKVQLRFNICNLESSFVPDEAVEDLEDRVKKYVSATLSYSCRYWGDHLSLTTPTEAGNLCKFLKDFLSHRLLFWMEVLNLSKFKMLGVFMLQKVQSWLEQLNCDGMADIIKLVSDAHDFVTLFSSNPVSLATPHIYISLLAFCHKSSSIFTQYYERMRGLLNVKGTAVDHRGSSALATWDTGESVTSVSVSPDGSMIAFGGRSREGRGVFGALNQHTGTSIVRPFGGHTGIVISVAFSPDCTRVVFGFTDGTIYVWNTRDGKLDAGPFKGHTKWITSVAFSPDGTHVVSGSNDLTICVWEVQNGKLVAGPIRGHANPIRSVAFSPDGMLIASGSDDKTICLWSAREGKSVGSPFIGHTNRIRSVAFSPDSRLIVSGADDRTICVWNVSDCRLVSGPLKGHTDSVRSVMFSPSGTRLVSGSNDGTICVWNAQNGELVAGPFKGHTNYINSVAFSPDGARIVSGSEDSTIFMWNAQDNKLVPDPFKGHTTYINSVAFSPDSTRIVSGSNDCTICVWDAQDGNLIAGPFEGHTDYISSVAFSSNGTRIVSGSNDRKICVWDAQAGNLVAGPFKGHTDCITSVAFSPDGMHIVSGSSDCTICMWDICNSMPVAGPLEGHTSRVQSVVFSSDGTQIVSGSSDGTICIWSAENGKLLTGPLKGPATNISSVAFSPDGIYVASSSSNSTVCVWDAPNSKLIAGPFEGHTDYISSVAFSHDGIHIVSSSNDNTICVWNRENDELVAGPLKGHTGNVTLVLFSPDGTHIASSSRDGTVRSTNLGNITTPASALDGEWDVRPSGWVINHAGQHLFWVPLHLRQFLPRLYHQFVIGPEGSLCINFSNILLGEGWSECYIG